MFGLTKNGFIQITQISRYKYVENKLTIWYNNSENEVKDMLLTVDIGNTNITTGMFEGDDLILVTRIKTDRNKTPDQYSIEFKNIFGLYGIDCEITGCAISSVVPELTRIVCQSIKTLSDIEPLVLAPGIKTGMNILTDDPAQVGADLVAGGVGAANLYPLPCLIIDLGTATKICLIDENGAFRGCTISPGIGISLEALSSRTSQLPAISLTTPSHSIGTNTIDSMESGIVFGTAAMLDGLCAKIEEEFGKPAATTVATGGLSKDIIKSCRRKIIHNGELIHHGLKIIYEKNNK